MTQTPTDALRLVPVEPTRGMMDAANRVDWTNEDERATIINIWQAMLAAAPASPLPGGGWQDISTAPKDGTLIMVGAPDCGVSLVRWMLDSWIDEQGFTQGSWPTHWMPLPAAPTGDA